MSKNYFNEVLFVITSTKEAVSDGWCLFRERLLYERPEISYVSSSFDFFLDIQSALLRADLVEEESYLHEFRVNSRMEMSNWRSYAKKPS